MKHLFIALCWMLAGCAPVQVTPVQPLPPPQPYQPPSEPQLDSQEKENECSQFLEKYYQNEAFLKQRISELEEQVESGNASVFEQRILLRFIHQQKQMTAPDGATQWELRQCKGETIE